MLLLRSEVNYTKGYVGCRQWKLNQASHDKRQNKGELANSKKTSEKL